MKCGPEPVETKQPRGSLASEHSPSPAGMSHPGQAHTVPFPQPSHPRAPSPIPTKSPFLAAQGCLQTIRHPQGWQRNHTREGRASLTQMILIF